MSVDNTKPVVLIVDDIMDNIIFLEIMLSKKGFNTVVAKDGKSALNYLIDNNPDIILLDIMMPVMDGIEVCKMIKSEEKTKHIPVIFLTSKNETDDIVIGFKAGGDDYITKPFNISELIARVTTHLNLKKERDKNKLLIDELSKKNSELSQKEQQLIELNATKDKFFSIVAHDLKNPFQGLLGINELLQNNYNDFSEEERIELINQISNSSNILYKLLDNLLIWSRIQMGTIQTIESEIILNEQIAEVFELFRQQAKDKQINLIIEVDSAFTVKYDRNILNTVLRNLVSNAIKFTNKNGLVKIYSEILNNQTYIFIEDNGVGMSKEVMDNLFRLDLNCTTHGTEKEEGSGLGLKICKELLETNSAELLIESKIGVGTKFIIKLI